MSTGGFGGVLRIKLGFAAVLLAHMLLLGAGRLAGILLPALGIALAEGLLTWRNPRRARPAGKAREIRIIGAVGLGACGLLFALEGSSRHFDDLFFLSATMADVTAWMLARQLMWELVRLRIVAPRPR